MASEFNNTPSAKRSTPYNIESLMTPNTSLDATLTNHFAMYGTSPSFSPSFSPFLRNQREIRQESTFSNKDFALTERGYQQSTSSNDPLVGDLSFGFQNRETVPRALFPPGNMNNNCHSMTQQPFIFAKKSAAHHDSDGETLNAVENIPGLEKTTRLEDLPGVAVQVHNPPLVAHSEAPQEAPEAPKEAPLIKNKNVRRTSKPQAPCPGGCQLLFVIGSNQFTSHLIEYHKLESETTRKLLRALHKKEANRKPAQSEVPCCSVCYNKCQTSEDAKACAASHDVDENTPLKCLHGCLQNKKPVIFKSKQTLQKHMRDKHGLLTKTAASKMTYTCHCCSKTFATNSNLKRHLKDVHKEVTDVPSTISAASFANLKQNHKDVHKGVTAVSSFSDPLTTVSTISLSILPMSTASLTTVPMSASSVTLSTVGLTVPPMTTPTTTVQWMPGSSGDSQNTAIQTTSVDEIVSFSQKSWSSTEGLILSQ